MKEIKHTSQLFQYFLEKNKGSDDAEMRQWRTATKENETLYTEIEKIVDWTADYPLDYQPNVEDGLASLKNRIEIEKEAEQKARFVTRRSYWRIAATVAFLVVAGSILYASWSVQQLSVQTAMETKTIELEDGSVVYLNEHSELQYAEDFGDCHRILQLKGEAFFEVNRNVDCPFVVETPQTSVTVLGTSFNVKALSSEAQTEVMVTSGKVEVRSNKSGQKTILTPREKIVHMHGKSLTKIKDENYHSVAWHTLDFRKERIEVIVQAMEKTYEVDIDLSQTSIGDCKYTLDLNKNTLNDALGVLKTSFKLEIEEKENQTFVLKGGYENCSNING